MHPLRVWHGRCNALGIRPGRPLRNKPREVSMSVSSKFGANVVSLFGALLFGAVMLGAALPVVPVA